MSNTKNEALARALRGAGEYVREHGHCKGTSQNGRGEVCAIGGIWGALRDHHPWLDGPLDFYEIAEAFMQAQGMNDNLHLAIQLRVEQIAYWNDASATTADDVINAFEKAAIWVEEQA